MKQMIKAISLCFIGMCGICFSANATTYTTTTTTPNKIIINRQPITLEKKGEVYVVPETYQVAQDYQYVVINGQQRACFLDKRPDFVNLDVVSINVLTTAGAAIWNCYALNPNYFVIQTTP